MTHPSTPCLQGVESHSWIQMSLFNRFFTFLVVNNFLAVTLAGALMDQIDAFIASPTSIVELLGNAVPKAATFFTTYVMVMSLVGFPAKLINPGGLVVGTAMKRTLATSDAQKDRVEVPVYEKYGVTYSLHIFVVLIGYSYVRLPCFSFIPRPRHARSDPRLPSWRYHHERTKFLIGVCLYSICLVGRLPSRLSSAPLRPSTLRWATSPSSTRRSTASFQRTKAAESFGLFCSRRSGCDVSLTLFYPHVTLALHI